MRIVAVSSYLVHPPPHSRGWHIAKHLLLVRVETDEGIVGWGEAFSLRDRELGIAQNVASLGRYLVGRDPRRIRAFTQWACSTFAEGRGALELYCAVSGIEQALWDILGKSLGAPVHTLFGGACRDRIRVYANGWTSGARTAAEMAERAAAVVALGFTAIKFYPFQHDEPEAAIADNVRAVREAIGPKIDLLIDVWRPADRLKAVRVARLIERYDVFWYEEPVPSEKLDLLAEARRAISLPVVTGECLYTKAEFREVFEKRAADIVNPDVASCGGILQLTEIAAMAEPHGVLVSPHNYNSTAVALAATLQASAVMPNFVITEYFINFQEIGDAISVNPFKVEGGCITVPAAPGLGLEIDRDAVKAHAYQEFPLRRW